MKGVKNLFDNIKKFFQSKVSPLTKVALSTDVALPTEANDSKLVNLPDIQDAPLPPGLFQPEGAQLTGLLEGAPLEGSPVMLTGPLEGSPVMLTGPLEGSPVMLTGPLEAPVVEYVANLQFRYPEEETPLSEQIQSPIVQDDHEQQPSDDMATDIDTQHWDEDKNAETPNATPEETTHIASFDLD